MKLIKFKPGTRIPSKKAKKAIYEALKNMPMGFIYLNGTEKIELIEPKIK